MNFRPQFGPTVHGPAAALALALLALTSGPAVQAQPAAPPKDGPAPAQATALAVKLQATDGTAQTCAISLPLIPLPGHGLFLLHLRLNGTTEATFLVDTGSNFCGLTQSLVQTLGLTPHPAVDDTGEALLWHGKKTSMVTVNSIEFPGARVLQGKMPNFNSQMLVLPDDSLVFPADTPVPVPPPMPAADKQPPATTPPAPSK